MPQRAHAHTIANPYTDSDTDTDAYTNPHPDSETKWSERKWSDGKPRSARSRDCSITSSFIAKDHDRMDLRLDEGFALQRRQRSELAEELAVASSR